MLNRFAKAEEDLLREQAEYLRNPRAVRIVNTQISSHQIPRNTSLYTDSSCLISPFNSKIIERNSLPDGSNFHSEVPIVEATGQPHAPVLGETIRDEGLLLAARRLDSEKPRKRSLFARQLLAAKEGKVLNIESDLEPQIIAPAKLSQPLKELDDIGPVVIRKEMSVTANELVRIHEMSINRLSQLSEEDIMRERETLLSSMDPKLISFLIHKKPQGSVPGKPMGTESSSQQETRPSIDTTSLLASLGLESATSIPHMDVVEPEKLAWMEELPRSAKAPASEIKSINGQPINARFDLEGRVVPPEANIPMHLGLHHHGEEPERGGYTISELFHLASSTHPNQRRIALSSLAAALAASRRGYHAIHLATPSLLPSLLLCRPPGICFLLRWALDRCVSEASCASSVTAIDGGVSVAIVGECLRALNNLLVDDRGETLLDEAFDWSTEVKRGAINLTPSEISRRPHKFRLKVPAPSTSDEGDPDANSDHADVMATDPVGCLFRETSLVARIGWMLSPGPALRFPPDAVAHAIPGLLITAVRHSVDLAFLVFETPHLIASIFERFLPLTLDDSVLLSNSDSLKSAYGVPLPRMLKLMRVLAQKNNSLRLSLVNKWKLADRCLTYLCHRFALLSENKVVNLLMLESLRCLSICLEEPEAPQRALGLTLSVLNDLIVVASETILSTNEKDLSLKIAWMSFFARILLPKFLLNFSDDQLEVVRSWAISMFEACNLEAYTVEIDGKPIHSLSSPLMINVAAQLLKALKMTEHITQLREKIFTGPTWTKVLNHFIRHQSVLTGFPNRMSQTSVLSTEFAAAYTAYDVDQVLNYNFPKDVIFESSEDGDPLSVLNVSNALPCLPDLGMSVCLFYRGAWAPSNENCEAKETTLPAMWWPPPTRSVYSFDVVEPLDLLPLQESKWTNFLPLIEAALAIGGIDLTPWCDQLRRLRVPPVVTKSGFPHGLMTIESSLMARYLLHLSEVKGDLWWAAFHLVSCLHFGQEALFIELMQKIIFPVYDITPIETGGFSETISNSKAPWPPIHESFSQGLAFYSHKLYGEYFADLFQRRSAGSCLVLEMKDIYKPLKTRPCCDLILPDDWFYMPILEAYFHHVRPPTEKDRSQVYFTVDPETYLINATAILGWIRGLLAQQPLLVSKNAFPRGVTAGGHFSRIICAILACQSAGALCYNLSGAIVAELVTLLLPRISFKELDASPEEHLPLDLISFYDMYTGLLEHYAAVSYTSPIFANIILLFLRPAALPVSNYRKALWGEHQATLRSIHLSPSEVFLPEDIYKGLFEPLETTQEVLRAYASAVCAGTISLNRQPLVTLIALHHLNRNIYLTKTDPIHEEFVKLLGTSLRFLASRRGTQELTDWLRLYMLPSGQIEKVSLSELVQSNRISVVARGNFRVEDLMEVYKEESLPPSRRKKWGEFMGN